MYLLVYCAGGLGKEVLYTAEVVNEMQKRWEKIAFIDDVLTEKTCLNHEVYKYEEALALKEKKDVEVVIGSGEPAVRQQLWDKLQKDNFSMGSVVYPSTSISPYAKIGKGVVIEERCSVSVDAVVGDNVHIQANAILGHDVEVGEHSLISAFCGIGGKCKIGKRCYLGMSTTVRQERKIGDDVIIGIGSAVFRNVKNGRILMGNPAKVIGENTGSVFHMFE